MTIPTEPIGSIPRPKALIEGMQAFTAGSISQDELNSLYDRAVRDTIEQFEATGSPIITDGEQTKPSFATYPIHGLETLAPGGVTIPFADGHTRELPLLTAGPFRYRTYADGYLEKAKKHAHVPVKQAVISASALSLLYPQDGIQGYPAPEFLNDLVGEAEKDIRRCLDKGAEKVQIDFTEGRLSLKLDPSKGVMNNFIALNAQVTERFSPEERQITAQLIKVADGFQLWSETYDREMEDVFAIQEGIAESITDALEVTLSPMVKAAMETAPTTDIEAYDFYLRGRSYFNRSRTRRDLELAEQMFSRAIDIDPEYAFAHAGLAGCYSYLYDYHSFEGTLEKANESSRRAVELGPELAEAHTSRGLALSLTEQWDEAAKEFEAAIRLNPKLWDPYFQYARSQFRQGKFEEAAKLFETSSSLDPLTYQGLSLLPQIYRSLGRESDAREADRRTLAVVERTLDLNPEDVDALLFGAGALIKLGEVERAQEWTDRALQTHPNDPTILYNAACTYANAGEIEKGVEVLERAVANGFSDKEWMQQDSDLDPLRDHPSFQALLGGMK